ncbi:MAG: binding-protein-dependent transport system inner rane component, partial [Reyranella sp.]|nr:binding-protein-dependent transport system inner rane component [Reyranella sp.]
MTTIAETTLAEAGPRKLRISASIDEPLPRPALLLAVAGVAWLGVGFLTLQWPDVQELDRTSLLAALALAFGTIQLAAYAGGWLLAPLAKLGRYAPWLVVLAIWLAAWEIVTAKLDLLPLPFFPSPQAFVEVYTDDWRRLGDSLLASLWLLFRGF